MNLSSSDYDNNHDDDENEASAVHPLIPCNFRLPRNFNDSVNNSNPHPQRSSRNVMGKMGYYCTDTCTPIISELVEELEIDASTVSTAVGIAINYSTADTSDETEGVVVYALCTHPGHHAARDSFGGYCYVNNAAMATRLLQESLSPSSGVMSTQGISETEANNSNSTCAKVAILDVDYHCGNGTASIFYNDPSVLVVSIHCHPDYEYPFHSGFGDETGGSDAARGCTLHLPLLPGATWQSEYQTVLREKAGTAILGFQPDAFVLSLGLDTHAGDPCATWRAGFLLKGGDGHNGDNDYHSMGKVIGDIVAGCSNGCNRRLGGKNNNIDETRAAATTTKMIPVVVLQEGGYAMEAVPSAAADVLLGVATAMGRREEEKNRSDETLATLK
mmetsp:Transcript_118835/g.242962  ORF Transcript_118835/g.242962 Transcript_118835/m.242962 type:complete len:388 (+) Transcript_118835:94-1257(+)